MALRLGASWLRLLVREGPHAEPPWGPGPAAHSVPGPVQDQRSALEKRWMGTDPTQTALPAQPLGQLAL